MLSFSRNSPLALSLRQYPVRLPTTMGPPFPRRFAGTGQENMGARHPHWKAKGMPDKNPDRAACPPPPYLGPQAMFSSSAQKKKPLTLSFHRRRRLENESRPLPRCSFACDASICNPCQGCNNKNYTAPVKRFTRKKTRWCRAPVCTRSAYSTQDQCVLFQRVH